MGSYMAAGPTTMPMETGRRGSGMMTSSMAAGPTMMPTIQSQPSQCGCMATEYQYVHAVGVACLAVLVFEYVIGVLLLLINLRKFKLVCLHSSL